MPCFENELVRELLYGVAVLESVEPAIFSERFRVHADAHLLRPKCAYYVQKGVLTKTGPKPVIQFAEEGWLVQKRKAAQWMNILEVLVDQQSNVFGLR